MTTRMIILKHGIVSRDIGLMKKLIPILDDIGISTIVKTVDTEKELSLMKDYIGGNRNRDATATIFLKNILKQLIATIWIIKNRKDYDIVTFYAAPDLILPMIFSRGIGKKTLLIATGSTSMSYKSTNDIATIEKWLAQSLESLCFFFSNRIVAYTPSQIKSLGISKYNKKIVLANQNLVDLGKFSIVSNPTERSDIIGYLGRLGDEKGIMNLILSSEQILKRHPEIKFTIIGDGPLKGEISEWILKKGYSDNFLLVGWRNHEELPVLLNGIKLLVVPSYTEGLPNAITESMACGVPVLATPVGGIPDIIIDNMTGYILPDNSPETISARVCEILEHGNLDSIARRARKLIEEQCSYNTIKQSWMRVINSLGYAN